MKNKTNQKILSTAKELFSKYGYKNTSTKLIAQESGVNEVTLFRNFKNKIGILYALSDELKKTQAGWNINIEKSKNIDPVDILYKLAELEINNALNYGLLTIRLILEIDTTPEIKSLLKEITPDNQSKLSAYFKFLQDRGIIKRNYEPDFISETFFSLTSSFVMFRLTKIKSNIINDFKNNEIKQIIEIFWSGISV